MVWFQSQQIKDFLKFFAQPPGLFLAHLLTVNNCLKIYLRRGVYVAYAYLSTNACILVAVTSLKKSLKTASPC